MTIHGETRLLSRRHPTGSYSQALPHRHDIQSSSRTAFWSKVVHVKICKLLSDASLSFTIIWLLQTPGQESALSNQTQHEVQEAV